MNKNVLDELIKVNNNLIIPGYLIKLLPRFDLNTNEVLMLIYFLNHKENLTFDINSISKNLYMDAALTLDTISSLIDKNLVSIEVIKNNGIFEEHISLELFLNKIKLYLIEDKHDEKANDIYTLFEEEFGRTLSPTEYETITNWLECNIPVDLIKSALKEAVLNGVNSLRYIDKILFEWNKKGYKSSSDIVGKKNIKNDEEELEELYDYDWLNN